MANDKGRALRRAARHATSIVEERSIPLSEVRFAVDCHRFQGTAAVFNQPAMIGAAPWGFRETIAPGAFTRTLRNGDVVMLADHDPSKPLARMSAGTLRLDPTMTVLDVDADLPNTSYAADLEENLRVKNVKGMSFGFRVVDDDWTTGDDGVEERTLREVELFEVSTTAFPAYTGTTAGVRQMQEMCEAVRSSRQRPAQRAIVPDDAEPADDDPDDTPGGLAAAIDAALDEAFDVWDDNPDQAKALVTSASASVDALLVALGVPDADETDERSNRGPASATRETSDTTGSAGATPPSVAHLRLRQQALAARFGLKPATPEGNTP